MCGAAAGRPGRGAGTFPRLQISCRGSHPKASNPKGPSRLVSFLAGFLYRGGASLPGPKPVLVSPPDFPSGSPQGLLLRSEMLPVTKRRARRPHPAVALLHLRLLTRGPPAGRGWFTPARKLLSPPAAAPSPSPLRAPPPARFSSPPVSASTF